VDSLNESFTAAIGCSFMKRPGSPVLFPAVGLRYFLFIFRQVLFSASQYWDPKRVDEGRSGWSGWL